ncbi:hypothetical protein [Phaeodactylibacter xiamenensis]|uniref:hypothetical protein n=1 Tax=Phaeodactylibacter xiamenensis TaxID=1524460 RepID=UPI003CCC2847
MDTIKIFFDSVLEHSVNYSGDIIYKIDMEPKKSNSFFRMDNPVWYLITIIVSGLIGLFYTHLGKRKEAKTDAKKVFLEKRIDAHQELYEIFSKAKIITNKDRKPAEVCITNCTS